MTDHSFLDEKYFVDSHIYNCPFCNRRHVTYDVRRKIIFDWKQERKCYAYFVKCNSCGNRSMHLSYYDIAVIEVDDPYGRSHGRFNVTDDVEKNLDDWFFYSVPTSFFVLDERILEKLRHLFTEAEGCLKMNFLTGASACARKVIYELAISNGLTEGNYDDRITYLKEKHPEVDGEYFDTLLTIQQATSSKVHENSYDGWEAKHVRLILSTLREILHELYVAPKLKKERREGILDLKRELLGDNPASAEDAKDTDVE